MWAYCHNYKEQCQKPCRVSCICLLYTSRVRICLIWTISRQILPTPWTVITRARWPMKTLMPVSYTHLDVYKRQGASVYEKICTLCTVKCRCLSLRLLYNALSVVQIVKIVYLCDINSIRVQPCTDVYKRQTSNSTSSIFILDVASIAITAVRPSTRLMISTIPAVSYTHLDVYKRQVCIHLNPPFLLVFVLYSFYTM